MAYERYYTDEKILELCKKYNVEPDKIDSKAVEGEMLAYYQSHKRQIESQNIDEMEKQILLNIQGLGVDLAKDSLLKEVAQYHGILLENHAIEKNKAGRY